MGPWRHSAMARAIRGPLRGGLVAAVAARRIWNVSVARWLDRPARFGSPEGRAVARSAGVCVQGVLGCDLTDL